MADRANRKIDYSKDSEEYREDGSDSEGTEDGPDDIARELAMVSRQNVNGPEKKPDPPKSESAGGFFMTRLLPGVIAGGFAVVAAPLALSAIGFTAGGIAAGSMAAGMMSSAAIANGGGVAAGSLVAVLQSAGAVGFSAAANAGIFTAATAVTTTAVEVGSRIKEKIKDLADDDNNHQGNTL